MKTFFSLFVIGMLSFNSFSQNSTKVLGIWQAKMNGKFMTGTDIGITSAPYSSRFIYYVFSKDKMYFVLAANKTSITSTGIPGMITKQDAMDGTYSVYDSMDLIPADIRSKYEAWNPFTAKTFFVEGEIQGNLFSFYYDVTANKFMGLNKETPVQLINVGAFK
jgi:hypothetical protein